MKGLLLASWLSEEGRRKGEHAVGGIAAALVALLRVLPGGSGWERVNGVDELTIYLSTSLRRFLCFAAVAKRSSLLSPLPVHLVPVGTWF